MLGANAPAQLVGDGLAQVDIAELGIIVEAGGGVADGGDGMRRGAQRVFVAVQAMRMGLGGLGRIGSILALEGQYVRVELEGAHARSFPPV